MHKLSITESDGRLLYTAVDRVGEKTYNADRMQFEKFAEYLEQLEKTASRVEMTKILAEMFTAADKEEARIIAYLVTGKLGPPYNTPDFGLADKQVIKVLQKLGENEAEGWFKKLGDLGRVGEEVRKTNPVQEKKLSVTQVYSSLYGVAETSGTGSQDKKIELLASLINQLSPLGTKYTIRMILGKLRTGFSAMTILDSLSWMMVGDKSLRGRIEQIYNVRADLGEVARLIKEQTGAESVKRLKVGPIWGTPVLTAQAERAKSAEEIWARVQLPEGAAAEHKLDGLRLQAHIKPQAVKLFSRGLEDITHMYPDIVKGLEQQVKVEAILDGEMIAVDNRGRYLPFQETVQRKRKHDIAQMASKIPLKYFAFDVLAVGGANMLEETNRIRREKLEAIIKPGETIKLIPRQIVKSAGEIDEFFNQALTDRTEGIVVKRIDSNYQSGSRNFNWIKYKKSYAASALADTIDAVVMGYDAGQGKRAAFGIGDFLIGVYDKQTEHYVTIAKIGTGLTDEEWRKMKGEIDAIAVNKKPGNYDVLKGMETDIWAKPQIVVEIMADEISKSPLHTAGLALRFPRLVSWREKLPEDTTSLAELNTLYQIQQQGRGVNKNADK